MVIIENDTRPDSPEILGDEDDHDGWAPVRPRRSSMPAALLAEAANENSEAVKEPPDASR